MANNHLLVRGITGPRIRRTRSRSWSEYQKVQRRTEDSMYIYYYMVRYFEPSSLLSLLPLFMLTVYTCHVSRSMECWFCRHGYTNRCVHGKSFGSLGFDGGQAEYVRVPFADGTLQPAPTSVADELLIMMCDIFPTGYYGAARAIQYFETQTRELEGINARADGMFQVQPLQDCVFVCLGCGPVGLCSILTCLTKKVGTVFAVDAVDDRLAEAERWGAIPLKLGRDDVKAKVLEATNGRGADAVIELVGNAGALKSAFEIVRPAGCLSSIGFHQGEVPFTALEAYSKNLE